VKVRKSLLNNNILAFIILLSFFIDALLIGYISNTKSSDKSLISPVRAVKINLSYENKNPLPVKIKSVQTLINKPPKKSAISSQYPSGYKVVVLDSDNKIISSKEIPDEIRISNDLAVVAGLTKKYKSEPLEESDFSLILPANINTKAIEVRRADNDKLIASRPVSTFSPTTLSTYASEEDCINKVNIVLTNGEVNGKGMAQDELEILTEKIKNLVYQYEPFKSRADQVEFKSFYSKRDYECKQFPLGGTNFYVPTCNHNTIFEALDQAQMCYDKVMVVVNGADNIGGFSPVDQGIAFITIKGAEGPLFVHEFGHLFDLNDEYEYDFPPAPFDGRIEGGNCYAGDPIRKFPAEWEGLVCPLVTNSKGDNYFETTAPCDKPVLGCTYPNYYRSSATSIMRDFVSNYFNKVSQRALTLKIDEILAQKQGIASDEAFITNSPLVPSLDSQPPTDFPTQIPAPTLTPTEIPTPTFTPTPTPDPCVLCGSSCIKKDTQTDFCPDSTSVSKLYYCALIDDQCTLRRKEQ